MGRRWWLEYIKTMVSNNFKKALEADERKTEGGMQFLFMEE